MKNIILPIVSLVISLVLITGCSAVKNTNVISNKEQANFTVKEQDIRELAYNQLTSGDKERIARTWKDSKLSKITLREGMGNITDKSYMGKEVYLVDFPTESNSIPNNMIVYLSIDSNKLLGYGFVE
ncbi:hypothetical protein SAMN05444401_2029 [Clostridium amylolyticum]|uniref:Uncharacterized protein n=1 Tax=Clostridium amylolyticum TaxID=1121298 RepID=A0A1M6FPW1_9CLOT|nr:hypothetical protein [Clostridium amylolyticum]SHI99705.1 hypothetical protein SAMN05444401_2029 [Clostridium amylolyticum]